jgi:PKD repeat protein
MRQTAFALAVAAFLIACGAAHADWVRETIATAGDQGQYASVAADGLGRVHAAWYDASNARLMYGLRDFTGWHVTPVHAGAVGKYASIAVNPTTDQPAIAYYNEGAQAAWYAYFDGSWHTEAIEDSDDSPRGEWTSLVFNGAGVPFASYHYDDGYLNDNGVRVAWRVGGVWITDTLDSIVNVTGERLGSHTAIAVSSADYPQVAYRNDTFVSQNQKFGWADGLGWHVENAITGNISGEHADIALDSGDNVYISFFDYETIGDNCASVLVKWSGSWSLDQIACGGDDFGRYTGIAIDAGDAPHVVYYADGVLQYADKTSGEWVVQTLDGDGTTGQYAAIALDGEDHPQIAYYDATGKDAEFIFDLPTPTVAGIDPDEGLNTGPITGVAITGAYFESTSAARLVHPGSGAQVAGTNVVVSDAGHLTADFDITGVIPGAWDVTVTNRVGAGTLVGGFEVTTLPPVLASVDPVTGTNDETAFVLTLTGNYFTEGMAVALQGAQDVEADAVDVNSTTEAQATIDLTSLPPGEYDVEVTTGFGQDTLPAAFTVTCGAPVAKFSGAPLSGTAPLEVSFTDLSEGTTSCDVEAWAWDFGDEGTATTPSPSHTYTDPGTYTVALTVTGAGGTDTETKTGYVTVAAGGDDDDDTSVDDDTSTDDDTSDDDDLIGDDRDDEKDTGGCGC